MKKDKILVYFCEKLVLLIMYKYYKIIFCFLLLGSFTVAQNLIPNQSTWTIKNDDEGGSLTIFLDESLETLLKEKEAAIGRYVTVVLTNRTTFTGILDVINNDIVEIRINQKGRIKRKELPQNEVEYIHLAIRF